MARHDARFSQADRDVINQAIKDAESQTSAEIIPVIAGSSGRYDRSEDIAGLWAGLAALWLTWCLVPVETEPGSWTAPSPVWQCLMYSASILAGFIAGAFVAGRIDWLRRLFTPAQQMREEVQLRARAVFFDQRAHHTTGATGVLLYVSLFERRAVLLADRVVVEALGQLQIDAMCSEFSSRLRTTTTIAALHETIHSTGRQLAKCLPRAQDDRNELSDALIVMD